LWHSIIEINTKVHHSIGKPIKSACLTKNISLFLLLFAKHLLYLSRFCLRLLGYDPFDLPVLSLPSRPINGHPRIKNTTDSFRPHLSKLNSRRHPKTIAYSLSPFSKAGTDVMEQRLLQKWLPFDTHGGGKQNQVFGRVPGVHHPTGLLVVFVPSQQLSENYCCIHTHQLHKIY